MTRDEFNAFCAQLAGASHVVQWGGADVWKVGGKLFAICGGATAAPAFTFPAFTFKVSAIAFDMLATRPGVRPAPYLASRGLSWVQHHAPPGLSDDELRDFVRGSHAMVVAKLKRRRRPAPDMSAW